MSCLNKTNPDAYLSARGLCIAAGAKLLVRGVDFDAHKGRVTGLVGESGSGKSLTCQAVMGLLPAGLASAGKIALGGADMPLKGPSSRIRKARSGRAAMILQNPMSCFDPVFTIKTHFRETLAAHGVAGKDNTPDRWLSGLAEVGFPNPDVLGLYPFQMSGGMLQRVMIALALAVEVDFLIADEATTDLDAVSQARVLDLVETLVRQRGIGVLLVTHDLSVIARLASDMLVMHDGVIVERGPVKTIFQAPRHEYTADLLAAHCRLYGLTPPERQPVETTTQPDVSPRSLQ
ncbi:Nickel import ATP-binding protein NikD [Pseudodesulfovibrio hydrargyri]|uniref:Nickel import ATP-binding protein NikD n=1 Tax=Pseudodesulfovibrio hydrargyri TaxID=2125990 RepID=A0A1J5NBG7_9BACT|nr:ABC transporter ATP-binding protein [Pseudodesulfovibrio hydrargyri]OIQ50567.1 Nickel import ATP-binding protein NikD [Pseudodesulfovibrio hydrargyri]